VDLGVDFSWCSDSVFHWLRSSVWDICANSGEWKSCCPGCYYCCIEDLATWSCNVLVTNWQTSDK